MRGCDTEKFALAGAMSTIDYDLVNNRPGTISIYPWCNWDTKQAQVEVSTENGKGQILIRGPKDRYTGRVPKGVIVLPRTAVADASSIKTEYTNKDGFWIHVPIAA
eukprot:6478099-Prymnesium_polylepis.1